MGQPGRRRRRSPEREPTRGTETSQYPEEQKSTEILLVAVSERGTGQTGGACSPGVVGPQHGMYGGRVKRPGMARQRRCTPGNRPRTTPSGIPSSAAHVECCVNPGGPPSKPKYSSMTDSAPVP